MKFSKMINEDNWFLQFVTFKFKLYIKQNAVEFIQTQKKGVHDFTGSGPYRRISCLKLLRLLEDFGRSASTGDVILFTEMF